MYKKTIIYRDDTDPKETMKSQSKSEAFLFLRFTIRGEPYYC